MNATEQLEHHVWKHQSKSYANEKTLRKAMSRVLANLETDGLTARLQLVRHPAGPLAGRVVPALVYQHGEQVPMEAIAYCHLGVLVFAVRA